mmetsp:Transcript_4479/g.4954  ORF Transcript_4479/g.4954 Transcript_4479/m.4954 type:complete len:2164 (+) Transcript_4479:538-7029(+)|eukprot:CAMPEP_0194381080 /NCGR_PEP_ID=MMETSP0174-20130528/50019_1 /TAXON_ID=216777 /ORGANISM="Proboscia alata, Strain PI-D3" /LENGTH=2163 /DNA_ID=CAMNT_0039165061 /DNA_START=530 /DNA_END=7021 /DNA_ORIENTATION=-
MSPDDEVLWDGTSTNTAWSSSATLSYSRRGRARAYGRRNASHQPPPPPPRIISKSSLGIARGNADKLAGAAVGGVENVNPQLSLPRSHLSNGGILQKQHVAVQRRKRRANISRDVNEEEEKDSQLSTRSLTSYERSISEPGILSVPGSVISSFRPPSPLTLLDGGNDEPLRSSTHSNFTHRRSMLRRASIESSGSLSSSNHSMIPHRRTNLARSVSCASSSCTVIAQLQSQQSCNGSIASSASSRRSLDFPYDSLSSSMLESSPFVSSLRDDESSLNLFSERRRSSIYSTCLERSSSSLNLEQGFDDIGFPVADEKRKKKKNCHMSHDYDHCQQKRGNATTASMRTLSCSNGIPPSDDNLRPISPSTFSSQSSASSFTTLARTVEVAPSWVRSKSLQDSTPYNSANTSTQHNLPPASFSLGELNHGSHILAGKSSAAEASNSCLPELPNASCTKSNQNLFLSSPDVGAAASVGGKSSEGTTASGVGSNSTTTSRKKPRGVCSSPSQSIVFSCGLNLEAEVYESEGVNMSSVQMHEKDQQPNAATTIVFSSKNRDSEFNGYGHCDKRIGASRKRRSSLTGGHDLDNDDSSSNNTSDADRTMLDLSRSSDQTHDDDNQHDFYDEEGGDDDSSDDGGGSRLRGNSISVLAPPKITTRAGMGGTNLKREPANFDDVIFGCAEKVFASEAKSTCSKHTFDNCNQCDQDNIYLSHAAPHIDQSLLSTRTITLLDESLITKPQITGQQRSTNCCHNKDVLRIQEKINSTKLPHSHLDVKFVLKALRRHSTCNRTSNSNTSAIDVKKFSFYTPNVAIVVPPKWSAEHRGNFLRWTTEVLGFSIRFVGAGAMYLQISGDRAAVLSEVMEKLHKEKVREKKLSILNKHQRQTRLKENSITLADTDCGNNSAAFAERPAQNQMILSNSCAAVVVAVASAASALSHQHHNKPHCEAYGYRDDAASAAGGPCNIHGHLIFSSSKKKSSQRNRFSEFPLAPFHLRSGMKPLPIGGQKSHAYNSLSKRKSLPSPSLTSSLDEAVHLDLLSEFGAIRLHDEQPHPVSDVNQLYNQRVRNEDDFLCERTVSSPGVRKNSISDDEYIEVNAKNHKKKPPRFSGEHCASLDLAMDFGMSPPMQNSSGRRILENNNVSQSRRPPSLLMSLVGNSAQRPKCRYSVGSACSMNSLGNSSVDRCYTSPFPRFAGITSSSGASSLRGDLQQGSDAVETPMLNRIGSQYWGSRPLHGKDWGQSTRCDASTLEYMLVRLDAYAGLNINCSPVEERYCVDTVGKLDTQQGREGNTAYSSSLFVHPSNAVRDRRGNCSNEFQNDTSIQDDFTASTIVNSISSVSVVDNRRDKDINTRLRNDVLDESDDEIEDDENTTVIAEEDDNFDSEIKSFELPTPCTHRTHPMEISPAPPTIPSYPRRFPRRDTVGASAFELMHLDSSTNYSENRGEFSGCNRERRSRARSFAKHRRVSLTVSVRESVVPAPPPLKRFSVDRFRYEQSIRQEQAHCIANRRTSLLCQNNRILSFDNRDQLNSSSTTVDNEKQENKVTTTWSDLKACLMSEDTNLLPIILEYFSERELLCSVSLISRRWCDAATFAHAKLMLVSVGLGEDTGSHDDDDADDDELDSDDDSTNETYMLNDASHLGKKPNHVALKNSVELSMERSWDYLNNTFPWAMFLSEGAFKQVYRVWNSAVGTYEAVSVMDVDVIESTGNKAVVGAELSVSALLSSMARRNICPNFVITRGVFTCPFAPPDSRWGNAETRAPLGCSFDQLMIQPHEPNISKNGRFQYIRMELCKHGDLESFISNQPEKAIDAHEARILLFQMAFSLHTAGDRFAMKHYDVKLLNFFLQSACDSSVDSAVHPFYVLRYGVGEHVFNLRMRTARAFIVKLADYGTANIQPESNGQPVTLGQFTTLENSPPEQMILGDASVQGFGHDMFGLGLCMLHLFTGFAPYEEILCDVVCPPNFKKQLCKIWVKEPCKGYDVIRSIILSDVFEGENGEVEGEPDDVLYDTFYRFLVLFGIPPLKARFKKKSAGVKVWKAIFSTLCADENELDFAKSARRNGRNRNANPRYNEGRRCLDAVQYENDCRCFSIINGNETRIAAAREKLQSIEGGMDLLLSLVNFDPEKRITALEVLNSPFMSPLRERAGKDKQNLHDISHSYLAYSTR